MTYSDFGYPSLFHYIPDAIEKNLFKQVIDSHLDVLVSFVVERPYFHQRRCVIGTGFFTHSSDPTLVRILTAAHVLDEFEKAGFGWITAGNQMIELRNIKRTQTQSTVDIATIEIDAAYFIANGLMGVTTLPLYTPEVLNALFFPTCSFGIFGYPHTKNRDIDMRDGGNRERNIGGIALHGYAMDNSTGELCFEYSGRSIPERWASRMTTSPAMDGMSGSPCIRFVIAKEQKRPGIVVAGVFTRWVQRKELRAVALSSPWLPTGV